MGLNRAYSLVISKSSWRMETTLTVACCSPCACNDSAPVFSAFVSVVIVIYNSTTALTVRLRLVLYVLCTDLRVRRDNKCSRKYRVRASRVSDI